MTVECKNGKPTKVSCISADHRCGHDDIYTFSDPIEILSYHQQRIDQPYQETVHQSLPNERLEFARKLATKLIHKEQKNHKVVVVDVIECVFRPEQYSFYGIQCKNNNNNDYDYTINFDEFIARFAKTRSEQFKTENKKASKVNDAMIKRLQKENEKLVKEKQQTKYYKSEQDVCNDCVMHSINNVLGNDYITNKVLGKQFVDPNRILPLKKPGRKDTKLKESNDRLEYKAIVSSDYDCIGVYEKDRWNDKENKPRKGVKPNWYQTFQSNVVRHFFHYVGAKETNVDFDFLAEDAVKNLEKILTENHGHNVIGLRFTYTLTPTAGGHSVGIRNLKYIDFQRDQIDKNRYWLWVQSWTGNKYKPLHINDRDLAVKLVTGHPHHKNWPPAKLYVVSRIPERAILPPPPKKIFASVSLDGWWYCVKNKLQGAYYKKPMDVWRKCSRKYNFARRIEYNGYDNEYEYEYDDQMYNELLNGNNDEFLNDHELYTLQQIKYLTELRNEEEIRKNIIRHQYYDKLFSKHKKHQHKKHHYG